MIYPLIPAGKPVSIKNKQAAVAQYVDYMFDRTQSMFRYKNLPDTIPQRILELMIQNYGHVCIAKHDGELYAYRGGLGGEPDVYYRPTIYTVSNPAQNFSANLKIGEDCELILNDSTATGLLPMFCRYATMMAENDITLNMVSINSRAAVLINALDDTSHAAAEAYLKDLADGKLGVIGSPALFDGVRTQPYATSGQNFVTQLIELQQYVKASWFTDLGLSANYNMKRESVTSAEVMLDGDSLLPLIDDMLRCRKDGIEKVNQMFGTSIEVELASAWEDRQIETETSQEMAQETSEGPEESEAEDDTET